MNSLPIQVQSPPRLSLVILGDLQPLLPRPYRSSPVLAYPLTRRASIKDIVEALGIPHTEVGRISDDDQDYDFRLIPAAGDRLTIHPQTPEHPVTAPSKLRPDPLPSLRFMADRTVGKLLRLLRMAGIDTASAPDGTAADIAGEAVQSNRILLSRNRELLKCRTVVFGRLLRSETPRSQYAEVVRLFDLTKMLKPFSRCLCCNLELTPVAKAEVLDRLEPLTRKYYDEFSRCGSCQRIYWPGSHFEHMVGEMGFAVD